MMREGRWVDACHAVNQTEDIPAPTDANDYEVATELSAHTPLRIAVRVMAAEEVAQLLRASPASTLRLRPFDPTTLPWLSDTSSPPPDDMFAREWLVLEVRLDVDKSAASTIDIGGVELSSRTPNRRDPNDFQALQWSDIPSWQTWAPVVGPPQPALARAMGFLRDPGVAEGMSFWSLVDIAALTVTFGAMDPKTRGTAPLLGSSATSGRQPSAEEQATVDALWKLVSRPCGVVAPGAGCSARMLLRRIGAQSVNSMRIQVDHRVGSPACVLRRSLQVPLPPARGVRQQLAAVFGSSGRSSEELTRRENELWSASEECRLDPSVCPLAADCRVSAACVLHGMCSTGATCAAQGDDCRATSSCNASGYCSAISGKCAPRPESAAGCERECAWYGSCDRSAGSCTATAPIHCAESMTCQRFGACQLDKGTCAPKTSADCASAEVCRERGWCTFDAGKCVAASDGDCARAAVCQSWKACKAVDGLCVAAPH
jgi:hypothetical protein